MLWIQHYVDCKIFKLKKLDGKKNTADLGTKDFAETEMRKCLSDLYVGESSGQHPLALKSVSA